MGYVMYWIVWMMAFILGMVTNWFINRKPDGLLNVDTRDPEKDFYDFVFLISTDEVPKRKRLTIEVKTKP